MYGQFFVGNLLRTNKVGYSISDLFLGFDTDVFEDKDLRICVLV